MARAKCLIITFYRYIGVLYNNEMLVRKVLKLLHGIMSEHDNPRTNNLKMTTISLQAPSTRHQTGPLAVSTV